MNLMLKAIRCGAAVAVLVVVFTLCCCKTVIVEKHVSLANGSLSATDGNQIFFVQEDGIYVAGMDMGNATLLVEQSDITQLAVNDGYIAYVAYQVDPSKPASSHVCDVFVLRKTDWSVAQRYACQGCACLYLVDARLYFVGNIREEVSKETIENESVGLYIMDFEQSDRIQTIRENDCVRLLDGQMLLFEDQNISYNDTDRLLFAKERNHNTESLGFRSYNTISAFAKDGLLMIPNTSLMVLTDEMPNKVQELFSFTDARDCFRVADYEFLPDNKLLVYTQFYDSYCYHDSDSPLNKHLFDRVYVLNEHYQQEKIYTTFSQQIILHADENRVVILDGRTVRSVDYAREELKTLGQIAPYGNELQVEVCAANLLFFSNGKMISSVSLA